MNLIPVTTARYGGPSAAPNPAWFRDSHGFVWFRCACGDLIALDEHNGSHRIAADGVVTPSVSHACGYAADVQLDGWEG